MPIKLYTGLPGNGKTSFMVEELLAEAKKAQRPIVASGIDGLEPGLALDLPNARKWNDVDANGQHIVPDGALVFIDEAWKDFGHLHDAGRQATPPHVLALAEHRHRGLDFVMTTQVPGQLYPFARGMIATHVHCVRRFGTQFVDLYSWEELNEDVKSASKRDHAQRVTRALPKEAHKHYKSASVHTIKAKIPVKVWMLPLLLAAAIACAVAAVRILAPRLFGQDAVASASTEDDTGSPRAAPVTDAPGGQSAAPRPMTAAEYAQAHLPRFPSMPWTAPVYDDRPLTAEPELYCVLWEAGENIRGEWKPETCRCYTEQATHYAGLSDAECRTVAKRGSPYNPYRTKHDAQRVAQASPPPPAPVAAWAAPAKGTSTAYGAQPRPSGTFALDPQAGGAP